MKMLKEIKKNPSMVITVENRTTNYTSCLIQNSIASTSSSDVADLKLKHLGPKLAIKETRIAQVPLKTGRF